MQIEDGQNTVTIMPLFYLTYQLQGEVLDKERNFSFCCPKIVCKSCVVHKLRLDLPDKVELLQLVRKDFFWLSL